MTPSEIRERLEDSRRRLVRRHSGVGLGFDALLRMIDDEIAFLTQMKQDYPAVSMRVDALVDGWNEYRDWLQDHNE